jgi:hypothetical protein
MTPFCCAQVALVGGMTAETHRPHSLPESASFKKHRANVSFWAPQVVGTIFGSATGALDGCKLLCNAGFIVGCVDCRFVALNVFVWDALTGRMDGARTGCRVGGTTGFTVGGFTGAMGAAMGAGTGTGTGTGTAIGFATGTCTDIGGGGGGVESLGLPFFGSFIWFLSCNFRGAILAAPLTATVHVGMQ